MRAILEVKGISRYWGDKVVLREVGVTIQAGEFIGVVGPNAAGKTTLLRIIAKLLEPTNGAVFLDGQAIATLRQRDVARQVAIVPQVPPSAEFAFPSLGVVLMGRYPHRGRFQDETAEDLAIARQAMAEAGILSLVDRPITEVSGGERQLVMFARALAQAPRLLLLDEPTANLDLCHQIEVLDTVQRLVKREGLAVVAAIHDLTLASRYCDRLLLLNRGAIVMDGRPSEVLTVERLAEVFGVQASVVADQQTGGLIIKVLAPLRASVKLEGSQGPSRSVG
jgi:iron complex transport system ATP-binding protein